MLTPGRRRNGGAHREVEPMRLTPLTAACASGTCPAVFLSDSGMVVVQGDRVDPSSAALSPSPGEALVAIPRDVLLEAARRLGVI